jgi:hypothetical protein
MKALNAQSTYICRVQSCVWVFQNIDPPPPSPPSECVPRVPPKAGGKHSPGGEGVGDAVYSIALRVFIIGLHYTAWALVKTVELSTIQLSLVGILYCTLPYVTYCSGLALLPNQIKSLYVQCDATITVKSSVLHLIIHLHDAEHPQETIHLGHNNHFKPLPFILGSSIGGQSTCTL